MSGGEHSTDVICQRQQRAHRNVRLTTRSCRRQIVGCRYQSRRRPRYSTLPAIRQPDDNHPRSPPRASVADRKAFAIQGMVRISHPYLSNSSVKRCGIPKCSATPKMTTATARPSHAPLRHRRDRQRELALQEPRLIPPVHRDLHRWAHRKTPRAPLRQPLDGHSAARGPPYGLPAQVAAGGQFWTPIEGQYSTPIDTYGNILDHCSDDCNKLVDQPWTIMSIGLRDWAHRF